MIEIPLNQKNTSVAESSWIKIKTVNYTINNQIYARSVNIRKMIEEDILNDLYDN